MKNPSVLKVRFISDTSSMIGGWLSRAFSAGCCCNRMPGAPPQAEVEVAPSAPKTHGREEVRQTTDHVQHGIDKFENNGFTRAGKQWTRPRTLKPGFLSSSQ
jgi:hypothetical protein